MILLDTSGLLSALDASEPHHEAAVRALRAAGAPRVISPFVLAELDYLLGRRVSATAQKHLLDEVASGAYELVPFDRLDVEAAAQVIDRYADLDLGLADASLVVLSRRYRTHNLLTLDERHFRAVRGLDGLPFRLLPADA